LSREYGGENRVKNVKKMKVFIPFLLSLLLLAACQNNNSTLSDGLNLPDTFRVDDFAGKRIAAVTGSVYDQIILEHIPGAKQIKIF
jgi:ABC-type amino acid transport substrate-binding protein